MKIPIVGEDYLVNCIDRKRSFLLVYTNLRPSRNLLAWLRSKSKGEVLCMRLLDCKILASFWRRTSIYNTTLSISDLSMGINSYYIPQIIQDDKSPDCYVFRK